MDESHIKNELYLKALHYTQQIIPKLQESLEIRVYSKRSNKNHEKMKTDPNRIQLPNIFSINSSLSKDRSNTMDLISDSQTQIVSQSHRKKHLDQLSFTQLFSIEQQHSCGTKKQQKGENRYKIINQSVDYTSKPIASPNFNVLNSELFDQASISFKNFSISDQPNPSAVEFISSLHNSQLKPQPKKSITLPPQPKNKYLYTNLTPFIIQIKQNVKWKFQPFLKQSDINPSWNQQQIQIFNYCLTNMNDIQNSFIKRNIEQYLEFSFPLLQMIIDYGYEKSFVQHIIIIAQFCYNCNDFNKAAFFYNEAFIIADITKNHKDKCQCFIGLAKIANRSKLQEEQISILKKALQYSIVAGDLNKQLEIYDMIGKYYYQQGEIVKSLFFHKRYTEGKYEDSNSQYSLMARVNVDYYEKSRYFTDKINKTVMLKLSLPLLNKYIEQKNENEYYTCDELKNITYTKCSAKFIIKQLVQTSEFANFFVDYIINDKKQNVQNTKLDPNILRHLVFLNPPQKQPKQKQRKYISEEEKLKLRLQEKSNLQDLFDKINNKVKTEEVYENEESSGIYIRQHINPVVQNNAINYFVAKQQKLLRKLVLQLH